MSFSEGSLSPSLVNNNFPSPYEDTSTQGVMTGRDKVLIGCKAFK